MRDPRQPAPWVPFFVAATPLLIASAAVFYLYVRAPEKTVSAAPVIGQVVILLTAFVGAGAALWTSNRAAQAQRETAKVLEAYKNVFQKSWDKDYIAARTRLVETIRQERKLVDFAHFEPLHYREDNETREAINSIANDHEITAIAIERDIIDEDFYRDWFLSTYIQDYETLEPYIEQVRILTKTPTLYIKFEGLAKRWRNAKAADELNARNDALILQKRADDAKRSRIR